MTVPRSNNHLAVTHPFGEHIFPFKTPQWFTRSWFWLGYRPLNFLTIGDCYRMDIMTNQRGDC